MSFAGDIRVIDVTSVFPPLLLIWNPPNELLMVYDCWVGTILLAELTIEGPTSVQPSVQPESWGEVKARYRHPD